MVEVARQLASALDAAERGAEALASIPDDDDAGDDDARSLADAVSEKVLWMETNATVRASLADAEGAFSAKFSEAENAGVRELAPNACARIDELVASAERKRDSGDFAGAKADYDLAAYMLGKAVVGGKRLRANSGVEAAEEFKRRDQWRQCYEAADAVLSNWDMLNARARALKSEAWDRMNSVPGPAPDSTDALNAFSAPSRRK